VIALLLLALTPSLLTPRQSLFPLPLVFAHVRATFLASTTR
jgi:hypothetical protein